MNESEFNGLAEETLDRIECSLESRNVDIDCSRVGDGVLEIEFDDGTKIVVSRHVVMQEIWVAARSGGYHFSWDGKLWRDTRDGAELMGALSELISAQAKARIDLD